MAIVKPTRRALRIRSKYRQKVKAGEWAYSERFDCYYDTKTLAWVEDKCSDATCEFCTKRPPLAPKRRATTTRGRA